MTELRKNEIYTVTVDGASGEGMGVARIDGRVVFVAGALVGEQCEVQILKVLRTVAYARITKMLAPSPERIAPDCPYFPRCGGCTYRHVSYAGELRMKQARVQDALSRIGGSDVRVEGILGAPSPLRYRNKAQYPVDASGAVGFYRARSHDVVSCEQCLLLRPEAEAAAEALRIYMARFGVSGYDERSGNGVIRHLFVRSNTQGECLVSVVANTKKLPYEKELVDIIKDRCPTAIGVVLNTNTTRNNVILGDRYRTLWGDDRLTDILCGLTFRLSVPSFYQVNHDQAERLYRTAVELADLHGSETVLDLYCGVGTITLVLAQKAKRVIGAEIVPEAIADAEENAKRNGIENATFFCGDAAAVAAKLAEEALRPDVVTVDPPRKGLAEDVVRSIAQMSPSRIVYVSCDPATLARDVARFASLGYRADRAVACDLFPRADHVESAVRLTREIRK